MRNSIELQNHGDFYIAFDRAARTVALRSYGSTPFSKGDTPASEFTADVRTDRVTKHYLPSFIGMDANGNNVVGPVTARVGGLPLPDRQDYGDYWHASGIVTGTYTPGGSYTDDADTSEVSFSIRGEKVGSVWLPTKRAQELKRRIEAWSTEGHANTHAAGRAAEAISRRRGRGRRRAMTAAIAGVVGLVIGAILFQIELTNEREAARLRDEQLRQTALSMIGVWEFQSRPYNPQRSSCRLSGRIEIYRSAQDLDCSIDVGASCENGERARSAGRTCTVVVSSDSVVVLSTARESTVMEHRGATQRYVMRASGSTATGTVEGRGEFGQGGELPIDLHRRR